MLGPLLIVEMRESIPSVASPVAVPAGTAVAPSSGWRLRHFLPDTLAVTGEIAVSPRYRGIFRAQTFRLGGDWRGRFRLPPHQGIPAERAAQIERACLVFAVSDARGLRGRPELRVAGQVLPLQAGTAVDALGDGFRAELPASAVERGGDIEFALKVAIEGTGDVSIVPAGDDTTLPVQLAAPVVRRRLPAPGAVDRNRGLHCKLADHAAVDQPRRATA